MFASGGVRHTAAGFMHELQGRDHEASRRPQSQAADRPIVVASVCTTRRCVAGRTPLNRRAVTVSGQPLSGRSEQQLRCTLDVHCACTRQPVGSTGAVRRRWMAQVDSRPTAHGDAWLLQYTEHIVATTFAVCVTDFDALRGSSLAAKLSVLTHPRGVKGFTPFTPLGLTGGLQGVCSGASGECASQAACAVALADSRLVSCLVDGLPDGSLCTRRRRGTEAAPQNVRGPQRRGYPDNDGQVQPHVRGSANSGDWRRLSCAQLLLGTHPTAKDA